MKSALALKVPPPVVVVVGALLMIVADRLLPGVRVLLPGQQVLALALAAAALGIGGYAIAGFLSSRTTFNPMTPERASTLVTGGLYSYSRNPMYVADILLLLALALWLGSPSGVVVVPLTVWYLTVFQIRPEEDRLTAIFGEDYLAYCRRVRRWV